MRSQLKWQAVVVMVVCCGNAQADCPDKPVSCSLGAVGSQGTCWDLKKVTCESCGPRHCPTVPSSVPKTYTYPCVEIVQADKFQVDGCSNPLTDSLDNLYKQLFYPACVQHDTCYHNNINIQKPTCDTDFKSNMSWICKSYYTGAANDAQLGACLAAVETWYQAVSNVPLATTKWNSDHAWTTAHCTPGTGGSNKNPNANTGPGPAKPPKK